MLENFLGALPGAVSQGLIWGIMAIGVYITYRILDLTMIGLLLSVFRNRTILRDTKPKIA